MNDGHCAGPAEALPAAQAFTSGAEREVAALQATLRLSEERLRLAQQVARVGSFEWNIQTGVNLWTPELEVMYGLRPGEFDRTLSSWEQLVLPEDRASAVAAVKRALDSEDSVEGEWRVRWPDGSVRWLVGRFRMIRDAAGQPQCLVGVNVDITRRKLAELELQQLNQRLEQLLSERTEQFGGLRRELEAFTYSVAHDLRAPLRGMHGFAKILLDEQAEVLSADGRDCLRRIQSNAVAMSQLVDGLLALAKVTLGELEPGVIDLSELARAANAEHAAREPERQVSVVIQGGLSAWADRGLIRSLFDNLLANAWKFTRKVPHACIEVGCRQQEGSRVYFVRDNGVGFNMEYANKLFVPFQRLHAPREFPGTAIGLAACHRIVARHGGRIWGDGKVGEGATFFFTLPSVPSSQRAGSTPPGA
jgi:PAS domain S-box-containing protein